jgi:hypothetical protein
MEEQCLLEKQDEDKEVWVVEIAQNLLAWEKEIHGLTVKVI